MTTGLQRNLGDPLFYGLHLFLRMKEKKDELILNNNKNGPVGPFLLFNGPLLLFARSTEGQGREPLNFEIKWGIMGLCIKNKEVY